MTPEPLFVIEREAPGIDACMCPTCKRIFPLRHFKRRLSLEETVARGGRGLFRMEVETRECRECRGPVRYRRLKDMPVKALRAELARAMLPGSGISPVRMAHLQEELERRAYTNAEGGLKAAATKRKVLWAPLLAAVAARANIVRSQMMHWLAPEKRQFMEAEWQLDEAFRGVLDALVMVRRRMHAAVAWGLPLPEGDVHEVWLQFVTSAEHQRVCTAFDAVSEIALRGNGRVPKLPLSMRHVVVGQYLALPGHQALAKVAPPPRLRGRLNTWDGEETLSPKTPLKAPKKRKAPDEGRPFQTRTSRATVPIPPELQLLPQTAKDAKTAQLIDQMVDELEAGARARVEARGDS